MSVSINDAQESHTVQPDEWKPDDEIDLRQYIQVLIDWWREILIIAILAALAAAAALYTLKALETPVYQASATVAIARVVSDISFDERFITLSEDTMSVQRASDEGRRAALVGLVSSGAIAQAVIEELGDTLDETEQTPAVLIEKIDANIVPGANARVESDLIRITARAATPEKAADIANAWAKEYVAEINSLYGQVPPETLAAVTEELAEAEAAYEAAQNNLEAFVADNEVKRLQRQLDEKQGLIDTLQAGKQTAVATIVDEELKARRDVISAYIKALSDNRLLGFTKEQEAKRELLEAYIDAEVQNRLQAIERDREARTTFFNHLADVQLTSATTVLDEQIESNMARLQTLYTERNEALRLLSQARLLERQIEESGDAAAETNALALTLLKAQMFVPPATDRQESSLVNNQEGLLQSQLTQTSEGDTPVPTPQPPSSMLSAPVVSAPVINVEGDAPENRVQLNVDLSSVAAGDAESQLADVSAIVTALDEQVAQLDEEIGTLSQALLTGDEYRLLDQLVATELGVSTPISGTLASTTQGISTNGEDLSALSQAVTQRYLDLFDIGGLAEQNATLAADSALLAQIDDLYPQLFELDGLSQLTEGVPADNPLAAISVEKAQQLLQLQGLEDIPSYTAAAEPLIQAIDKLESEIQALEALLEAESARELQLTQQRDLAWTTYDTLSNKVAELNLVESATNREVRFAAPAVPPVDPIPGPSIMTSVAIAGLAGLMLGVLIAFVASFMGASPPLNPRARGAAA